MGEKKTEEKDGSWKSEKRIGGRLFCRFIRHLGIKGRYRTRGDRAFVVDVAACRDSGSRAVMGH